MQSLPPAEASRRSKGQGLVEYGLIIGLVAIIAIAALNATGESVNGLLTKVATATEAAATCVVTGAAPGVCSGTCTAGKTCSGTPAPDGVSGCSCS